MPELFNYAPTLDVSTLEVWVAMTGQTINVDAFSEGRTRLSVSQARELRDWLDSVIPKG